MLHHVMRPNLFFYECGMTSVLVCLDNWEIFVSVFWSYETCWKDELSDFLSLD